MANTGTSYSDWVNQNKDKVDATIARMAPKVEAAQQASAAPVVAPAEQAPVEPAEPSSSNAYGALEPGNIDLSKRPHVMNPDGSVSTVRSMGVGFDDPDGKVKEYLIPTVSDDGHLLDAKSAIEQFKSTGKHLGVYATPEDSTRAALAIHRDQAAHMPENTLETVAVAPAGKPQDAIQTLTHEQVKTKNDTAASFQREGEAKASAAQERATVLEGESQKSRRYAEEAERVHASNREKQDVAQKWLDEDMATLRKPPVPEKAWQKTVGILAGIVGATAQGYLGDLGSGIAYGMQSLNDYMHRSVIEQLQAKEEAGHNLQHTEKYIDGLAKDSTNETDIAAKLAANHWIATSHALDAMAEKAKVPEYKETAKRLALEAKAQGVAIYKSNAEKQLAEARAAAAARAKAAKDADKNKWSQYSLAQLEAWEPNLPLDGLAALNKARMDSANVDKTRGEVAKLAAGNVPGEPTEIYPGFLASRPLTAGLEAKATTIYGAGASIKADLARLAEMRARNQGGTWDRNDVKEAKGIMATLPSRYSQMFGSGAPNNTELDLFSSFLVDPTDYQMTGLDVDEAYKRLAAQVDRTAEAQLAGFGIKKAATPETAGPAGPDIRARGEVSAAPAPDPNAPVAMISNNGLGGRFMIPPARVAAARNQGFVLASEIGMQPADRPAPAGKPAPAPAPPPSNEDTYAQSAFDISEDERVRRRAMGLE